MSQKSNKFLTYVILFNGLGDLVIGILLTSLFPFMAQNLDFVYSEQMWFLGGGWGIAALSYAFLRFYCFNKPKYHHLMLIFGLIEGSALVLYTLAMFFFTELTFEQISVTLLFSFVFTLLYLFAYGKDQH